MPFISFNLTDPDETPLARGIVTIFGTDGSIEVQNQLIGASHPEILNLAAGTWRLWIRADGFLFTAFFALVVAPEDGPDVENPRVVDLIATGVSVQGAVSAGWAHIYGFVDPGALGQDLGQAVAGFAVQETTANRSVATYPRRVQLIRVEDGRVAGNRMISRREVVVVDVDTNGRFEAVLFPNTVYQLGVPGIPGLRLFRTGAAWSSSSVEALVEASGGSPIYGEFV